MSFGKMPIANGFIEKKYFNKEYFFDMQIGFSKKVSLFQLNNHPKPDQMFNKNYPFFTGSSKEMINHFKKIFVFFFKFLIYILPPYQFFIFIFFKSVFGFFY